MCCRGIARWYDDQNCAQNLDLSPTKTCWVTGNPNYSSHSWIKSFCQLAIETWSSYATDDLPTSGLDGPKPGENQAVERCPTPFWVHPLQRPSHFLPQLYSSPWHRVREDSVGGCPSIPKKNGSFHGQNDDYIQIEIYGYMGIWINRDIDK